MKIAYVRVSTQEQNLDRQIEAVKAAGVAEENIFQEKASGKDTERPELQRMFEYIRPGDTIVVESISRLARSAKDLLNMLDMFRDRGIEFVSLKECLDTSTPAGRMIFTVFAAVSELERAQIRQRQREGIKVAKALGKYKGRPKKQYDVFEKWYQKVKNKDISVTRACKALGISRATWYSYVREWENKKQQPESDDSQNVECDGTSENF